MNASFTNPVSTESEKIQREPLKAIISTKKWRWSFRWNACYRIEITTETRQRQRQRSESTKRSVFWIEDFIGWPEIRQQALSMPNAFSISFRLLNGNKYKLFLPQAIFLDMVASARVSKGIFHQQQENMKTFLMCHVLFFVVWHVENVIFKYMACFGRSYYVAIIIQSILSYIAVKLYLASHIANNATPKNTL